jgi:sarcosine oxidase, subunit alpha
MDGHVPHHSKKMETPLAGLSIAKHAGKDGSEMDQLLEKTMQNIRTVRQKVNPIYYRTRKQQK